MAVLNLIITTAGQTLLAQAGTLGPVQLSKVAIGSGTWATAPTVSATALKTQIKQLTPSGSSTPSAGVIHITATDDTTDAYNVYEIGLYTSTNVLFAIAGGTSLFLTKATGSSSMFAVDLNITNVPSGSLTIGTTGFSYPQATETVVGVAEIATTAEVTAGTDDARIVTPLKLASKTSAYLPLAGGTVTGAVLSSITPTVSTHLTNKAYVDGTVSKTANGYVVLPNGLIMQWGTSSNQGTGQTNFTETFPIAFPNTCLNMVIGIKSTTGNAVNTTAVLVSYTSSNFVWNADGVESPYINAYATYVAFGY